MGEGFNEGISTVSLLAARHIDRMSLKLHRGDYDDDDFYSDLMFLRQTVRHYLEKDDDFQKELKENQDAKAKRYETMDVYRKRLAWEEYGAIVACLVRRGAFAALETAMLETTGIWDVQND